MNLGRDCDGLLGYLMALFQLLKSYSGDWGEKMIMNNGYLKIVLEFVSVDSKPKRSLSKDSRKHSWNVNRSFPE
jgi:hypothetical protein